MTLGTRLRQAREAKRLPISRFAALLSQCLPNQSISRSAVSQWEHDKTAPTLDKMEAISKLLDVNGEWLLTARGPKTLDDDSKRALEILGRLSPDKRQTWLNVGDAMRRSDDTPPDAPRAANGKIRLTLR